MYNVQGLTLPFFPGYWMGARSTQQTWPNFKSIDPFGTSPTATAYSHWGVYEPPYDPTIPEPEPNNKFGMEYCLASNYTQGYGLPYGWGYQDVQCNRTFVPLCKVRPLGSMPPVPYTSNATGSTFVLFLESFTQAQAQAECNKNGHHLATFASEAEQYEVESFYANEGYFFPTFPPASYWIGYSLNSSSGNWTGLDLFQPTTDDYSAWGM
jgi:hypothetical protein